MERPSIRQLEYAVAVADRLHFGRAAKACHVTQPALSTQVQALEEQLEVRLFERSRRGVVLTRAGERIIERARVVLRSVDDLVQVSKESREPLSGSLHLGVIPTVAPYWLPRWLRRVRRSHPELNLFLHEDQTDRIVAALRAGSLDLLLLALPVDAPDLESLPLFLEPFVVALPRRHPLAARPRIVERDLEGEQVLLLADGHCLRDQALSICSQVGAVESSAVRASSLNTLVQMVASGLGITLLPLAAVPVELRGISEIEIRELDSNPHRIIGFTWRAASPRSEAFRQLARHLERAAPAGVTLLRDAAETGNASSPG